MLRNVKLLLPTCIAKKNDRDSKLRKIQLLNKCILKVQNWKKMLLANFHEFELSVHLSTFSLKGSG